MKRDISRKALAAAIIVGFGLAPAARAVDFFIEDFEDPVTDAPNPVWTWETPLTCDATGCGNGMPVQENVSAAGGDAGSLDFMVRVDNTVAGPITQIFTHDGNGSLAYNYDGRNAIGDSCINGTANPNNTGTVQATHAGPDDSTEFIDSLGQDLSTIVGGDPVAVIYNTTKAFERWDVNGFATTSMPNDTATFAAGPAPGIHDQPLAGDFDTGDNVVLARACAPGERRQDNNIFETQISGFSAGDITPGSSLFLRFYIYLPAASTLPGDQKLLRNNLPDVPPADGSTFVLTMVDGVNGPNEIRAEQIPSPTDSSVRSMFLIPENTWTYIEVQIQAATGAAFDGGDGVLRVWAAPEGVAPGNPIVEVTDCTFGPPAMPPNTAFIFPGNTVHSDDMVGQVFIDDIHIADERVGPSESLNKPNPPANFTRE
jgi:hypothetical protein